MKDAGGIASAGGDGSYPEALDPSVPIRLSYLAPPPDLEPFVTTFFLFRCDAPLIRDIQPTSLGQVRVYLRGSGRISYPDGRLLSSFPETIQGPTTSAVSFEMDGPAHMFGAALSALGWGALTGIPGHRANDRLLDMRAVLGEGAADFGEAARSLYRDDPAMDGEALVERAAAFIRPMLKPVPEAHAAVLRAVPAWLGSGFNPPLHELHARCDCSPRQVQRFIRQYYGSSPSHLVRAYRAVRVAALLSEPEVTDERVAELTEAFYDQPHMIREIRAFVGRTPARLLAESETVLRALVDVRNFRGIEPGVAPPPPLESEDEDA